MPEVCCLVHPVHAAAATPAVRLHDAGEAEHPGHLHTDTVTIMTPGARPHLLHQLLGDLLHVGQQHRPQRGQTLGSEHLAALELARQCQDNLMMRTLVTLFSPNLVSSAPDPVKGSFIFSK